MLLMNILSSQYFSLHSKFIQEPTLLRNRPPAVNRAIINKIPGILNRVLHLWTLVLIGAPKHRPFTAWLLEPTSISWTLLASHSCMKNQ